jgi:two-component system, chemotaxis family, CheB/CheR fusion protein
MPRSAIAAGCVDFVLTPHEIAAELARIAKHPYLAPDKVAPADPALLAQQNITPVLELLHKFTGADFAHYKRNTLIRRITRRAMLHRLDGLDEYIKFLKANPAEIQALYQDVLINVTSFFRNPEAYEILKQDIFPKLAEGRARNDTIRIWVLGCSTGEEAYSIAIAFSEFMESAPVQIPLQIFATDLNGQGIERARAGVYSRNILLDVSPERLRRYFMESEGSYRVRKSIRDCCIFATHNVLSEPPFSRIDLVSCRNVLIYLGQEIQQRVIPILHYALRPGGYLWLGTSETIGSHRESFDFGYPRHKIYRKKPSVPRTAVIPIVANFRSAPHGPGYETGAPHAIREAPLQAVEMQRETDRILIARYGPASVLVNFDMDILQFRGETGRYLTPAPGRASLNLFKMLREGLLVAVRALIHKAKKEERPARREGLELKLNGGTTNVNIEVIPVKAISGEQTCLLVVFDEKPVEVVVSRRKGKTKASAQPRFAEREVNRLTEELAAMREYLQSVIEQQEAANEELQSANEEVQSANEELQSTNEELETSKEETQSSNEELATVNDELHHRNDELVQTNNDLLNLLASVQMAIVMLGLDLRIRRLTSAAEKILNLIPSDVGRPIKDLNLNISIPDLERQLEDVINTVAPREFELLDRQGRWHSMRLRPYRTLDNKIDGVVMVVVDIDALKRAEELLQRQADLLDRVNQPILMWELHGNIIYWNRAAQSLYGFTQEHALHSSREKLLSAMPFHEIEQVLQRDGLWTGDILHTTHDGRRMTLNSRMVLARADDGREIVIEANRPVVNQ